MWSQPDASRWTRRPHGDPTAAQYVNLLDAVDPEESLLRLAEQLAGSAPASAYEALISEDALIRVKNLLARGSTRFAGQQSLDLQ